MARTMFGGLTYRQLAERYGLLMCTDAATCRRKLSAYQHEKGAVDSMGHIHWQGGLERMTKSGLHRFLVLVASVKLDLAHSKEPMWIKRWRRNTWAHAEGLRAFHVRFPAKFSDKDRRAARYESQWSNPRSQNVVAYQWMVYQGRRDDRTAEATDVRGLPGHGEQDLRPAGRGQGDPDQRGRDRRDDRRGSQSRPDDQVRAQLRGRDQDPLHAERRRQEDMVDAHL